MRARWLWRGFVVFCLLWSLAHISANYRLSEVVEEGNYRNLILFDYNATSRCVYPTHFTWTLKSALEVIYDPYTPLLRDSVLWDKLKDYNFTVKAVSITFQTRLYTNSCYVLLTSFDSEKQNNLWRLVEEDVGFEVFDVVAYLHLNISTSVYGNAWSDVQVFFVRFFYFLPPQLRENLLQNHSTEIAVEERYVPTPSDITKSNKTLSLLNISVYSGSWTLWLSLKKSLYSRLQDVGPLALTSPLAQFTDRYLNEPHANYTYLHWFGFLLYVSHHGSGYSWVEISAQFGAVIVGAEFDILQAEKLRSVESWQRFNFWVTVIIVLLLLGFFVASLLEQLSLWYIWVIVCAVLLLFMVIDYFVWAWEDVALHNPVSEFLFAVGDALRKIDEKLGWILGGLLDYIIMIIDSAAYFVALIVFVVMLVVLFLCYVAPVALFIILINRMLVTRRIVEVL